MWNTASHALDDVETRFRSACDVFYGIGRPAHHKLGYLALLALAEDNQHVPSMVLIAECLLHGRGVGRDPLRSLAWLEKAAFEFDDAVAKARFAAYLLDERSKHDEEELQSLGGLARPANDVMKKYFKIYHEGKLLNVLAEAAEGGALEAETKLAQLLEKSKEYEDAFKL